MVWMTDQVVPMISTISMNKRASVRLRYRRDAGTDRRIFHNRANYTQVMIRGISQDLGLARQFTRDVCVRNDLQKFLAKNLAVRPNDRAEDVPDSTLGDRVVARRTPDPPVN